MRNFRIRPDIERVKIGSFALPLGVGRLDTPAPVEGYTIKFEPGEEGEPDAYAYQVVVSHEQVRDVLHDLFSLLPAEVSPVVEIGSVDAYRSIDVYVSSEPISLDEFSSAWSAFEPILLEEVSIGAGVTVEEPFLEIFVDAWKSITVHCPEEMRSAIEERLEAHGIEEVPQTWPDEPFDEFDPPYRMREILLIEDEHSPDIDEFLLIQLVAPLASESPEFIVANILVLRHRASTALGALVSSKVNQWTLLVGAIPIVYSLSKGSLEPLELESRPRAELVLTSAQSLFAIAVLADLRFGLLEALALLVLYIVPWFVPGEEMHYAFAVLYFVLTLLIGFRSSTQREDFARLLKLRV